MFLQGRLRVVFFLSILQRAKLQQLIQFPSLQCYYSRSIRSVALKSCHLVSYTKPNFIQRNMGNQESVGTDTSSGTVDEAPPPQVTFTKEELESRLTKEQYHVTQQKGTERAFTGEYVKVEEDGTFACVVCDNVLFKTDNKFESHSGWPSFTDVAEKANVVRIKDTSLGMVRIEVVCRKCGAHLGHVFEDGPKKETGLRYCINSASLKFNPESN